MNSVRRPARRLKYFVGVRETTGLHEAQGQLAGCPQTSGGVRGACRDSLEQSHRLGDVAAAALADTGVEVQLPAAGRNGRRIRDQTQETAPGEQPIDGYKPASSRRKILAHTSSPFQSKSGLSPYSDSSPGAVIGGRQSLYSIRAFHVNDFLLDERPWRPGLRSCHGTWRDEIICVKRRLISKMKVLMTNRYWTVEA